MARIPEVGPYCWVDITEEFQTAVKDLKLGELVHDDLFGLFEAMSAIEMMDPKMDAGMNLGKNISEKPLNFEQSVQAGKLSLNEISPSYLVGIMDNSLACLVTWLEGHSLAQTIFINLYTHNPVKIEDKYLRSFVVALLKVVDIIKDLVNQAAVFEEEDFQPMIYGYRLASDITDQKALAQLRECEEDLKKKTRNAAKSAKSEHTDENGTEENVSGKQLQESTALLVRFRFIRQFYQMLLQFSRKENPVAVPHAVEEILKSAQGCAEALTNMLNTLAAGLAFGENELEISGFEPQINQRLLPPTFPRYTNIRSRKESLDYLTEFIGRVKTVCKVKDFGNFHLALDFFYSFSRLQPLPCVLSRSMLQLLYIPLCNRVLGQMPLVEALQEAARSFIAPPALTGGLAAAPGSPHQAKIQECVDQFFLQCVRPMGTLIQIAGHNLARQRDKLAHVLQELAVLQEEADKADAFLHTISMQNDNSRPHLACFGTWVLFHTLRTMIQYLLAGFELALYSTHEYCFVFWYLYEFLYGWMISAYSRADSFLAEHQAMTESQASGSASRGGKGKGGPGSKRGGPPQSNAAKGKKNKKEKGPQGRPYAKDIARCQALQNICGGYYKAMIALELEGRLRRPKATFDNEQVRYEHRFAPFGHLITPPAVPYIQFKEMTTALFDTSEEDVSSRASNLYASAYRHFHQAATILDSVFTTANDAQIAAYSRVCKTNCVVMRLLAGGHKREGSSLVSFDFSVHPHCPIIKVV